MTEEVRIAQGTERTADYLASPLRDTIERGNVLRRRLDGTRSEFPLLEAFRAEGCTDYVAAPLNRIGQRFPVVAWATDRAGGFADGDLALLDDIRPAIAAVVEAIVTRRTARGLFSIYHGLHVGERVFDGHILRGHSEPLRAVIMTTDLRGFTGISDRLPAEEVIGVLDAYFEYVVASVHAAGGHVLKFIGDGVLAIFGTEGERDGAAAAAGLAAARAIVARLADHNAGHAPSGVELHAGIGLHIGTVMYGNVGAPDRLDFTAIGPAVNLAFRLEGLTKDAPAAGPGLARLCRGCRPDAPVARAPSDPRPERGGGGVRPARARSVRARPRRARISLIFEAHGAGSRGRVNEA